MEHLESLLGLWSSYPPYQDLVASLKARRPGEVFGLSGSLPAFVAAALARDVKRSTIVVTAGFQEARQMEAELRYYLPQSPLHLLPPRPHVVGDIRAESHEWEERRLAALAEAWHSPQALLVVPVEAARQRQIAGQNRAPLVLEQGQVLAPRQTAAALVQLGYARESEVTGEGQFAWRGGILDVFPPGNAAFRIEWFDDEIDSVRTFDPSDQRTVAMTGRVRIGPARELLWTDQALHRAIVRIGEESERLIKNLESMGQFDKAMKAKERYGRYLHDLAEGRSFPGIDRFSPAFSPLVALPRLFAEPPLIIYDDWPRIQEALRGRDAEEVQERQRRLEHGDLLPVETESTLSHETFAHDFRGHAEVSLSLLAHTRRTGQTVLTLTGRPAPRAHGQMDLLKTELSRMRKARMKIVLVLRDTAAAQIMQNNLIAEGLPGRPGLGEPGEVGVLTGQIGHGFLLPELGLALLGETELSGREVRLQHTRRRDPQRAVRIPELRPGDHVVHVAHGIGRFLGIRTLEIQGQHKDYLHVQYAGEDTLYVPVDQLNLVQKYVGIEGQEPKLSKMGGTDWTRAKDKVRASVQQMAEELIKLYALRESQPGYAVDPDTSWQADFEAAFPYEETDDQIQSIRDIKQDMERPRPMDRLLCGDVGYGKTEVALRAAFKSIMSGRQVAFLVPTTLLAEQHFATAKSRLTGYPMTVEVLSRFRSPKQQKDILERLARGQIDLVVGTHRLLGKDVRFQQLGLLVIDEEHRFGVAHKERIKTIRGNVDVLTLTATPIPRTLHMAMVGIRDMSLIETPPEDRLPVETVVAEFDPDLIREAIRREVDRGGQVYYVQNRIMAMDVTVSRLLKMFPDLRVAVVHGQMEENRIEDVMARFIGQEYDVLVATNIIESGLDIPNANTLVVEDADRLGLAQLYQLRGRVGRSSRLAYAYFTYRVDKVLSPAAEKRLEAIREFTELGAGYQIALRDLEIRGAGNLLGAEQHGFIASIGFDLYTQLLAAAIRELKGEPAEAVVEPSIELAVDAYLPDSYVSDPKQKIEVYKRLVSARSLTEVDALSEEIEDRFGPSPEPVITLVALSRVRVLAQALRITGLSFKRDRLLLRGSPESSVGQESLHALARRFPGRLLPGAAKAPELGIRVSPKAPPRDVLNVAEDALRTIWAAWHDAQEEKSG